LKKYAAVQFEAAQRWAESAHTQVKIGATTEALNLYRDAVVVLERAAIEARSKQQYQLTREFQVEWERTTKELDPTSTEAESVAEPPAEENVAPSKPVELAQAFTNSIGMKLILIPAGEFLMGSSESSRDAGKADNLQRLMKISQPFLLGAYEVTQEEFGKVMVAGTGTRMWSPSHFKESGRSAPVENFDGRYAEEFCKWLSALPAEQEAGRRYRLPTEAEWEYACRAGSTSQYCFGDDAKQLTDYAWFGGNSGEKTHPVGAKRPNAWGLYDMYGNVAEWCSGEAANSWVLRGGSFKVGAESCRSASRHELFLGARGITLGFRVAGELLPGTEAKSVVEPPAREKVAGNKRVELAEAFTNSIGMKLVFIPAGEFLMGSPGSEKDRQDDEQQHRVRIMKPFYLGVTEVTQGQWEAVMGTRPWSRKDYVKEGSDYPATYLSWDDAVRFCQRLSTKEGGTYRLPTEAEWECACRGGSTSVYHFGDDASRLGDYAWFADNAYKLKEMYAHQVAQKKANAFGLHDMAGNVWEWCADWYDKDYYAGSPPDDPKGPASGSLRVLRGGCWFYGPGLCRSADRGRHSPVNRHLFLGFRVARSSSGE
jgi:formylglycine-generating enzyme required for sulfatase activity